MCDYIYIYKIKKCEFGLCLSILGLVTISYSVSAFQGPFSVVVMVEQSLGDSPVNR